MFKTANGAQIYHGDTYLQIEHAGKTEWGAWYEPGRKYLKESEALRWAGFEARYDELGRRWQRQIYRLVIDDFGSLVEVPA